MKVNPGKNYYATDRASALDFAHLKRDLSVFPRVT